MTRIQIICDEKRSIMMVYIYSYAYYYACSISIILRMVVPSASPVAATTYAWSPINKKLIINKKLQLGYSQFAHSFVNVVTGWNALTRTI